MICLEHMGRHSQVCHLRGSRCRAIPFNDWLPENNRTVIAVAGIVLIWLWAYRSGVSIIASWLHEPRHARRADHVETPRTCAASSSWTCR